MFTKKSLLWVVASLAVVALTQTSIFAAPLFNGAVNEHEDQDWEGLFLKTVGDGATGGPDAGTTDVVEVGDLIAGVLKISQVQTKGPPDGPEVILTGAPDTFTAIFLLRCISSTGEGAVNLDFDSLHFAPGSAADWATVYGAGGLLDVSSAFDVTFGGAGPAVGTMALYFDGVSYAQAQADPPGLPTPSTFSESATSFVAGGNLLWELGFTGAGGTAAADQFWRTDGIDADITYLTQTNRPTNRYSMGVTAYHAGAPLLPQDYLGSVVGDAFFTGPTEVTGFGSFQPTSGPWPLGTDTNLYMYPTPEPGSLLVFSLLAAMGGVGYARRRKTLA